MIFALASNRWRQSPWLLLFVLFLSQTGCSHGLSSGWSLNPFAAQPTKTTYVTPAQKIQELKTLAEEGPGDKAATPELVVARLSEQLKKEADPLVRTEIVRTLKAFPTAPSVFVLDGALADQERDVRIAACEALAGLQYREAQEALIRTLEKDADIDVRLAAARSLGHFPNAQSTAALGKALDDVDPAMRNRAMLSLERVTGQDFGGRVDAWRMYVRGETPPPAEPISVAQRLRGLAPF